MTTNEKVILALPTNHYLYRNLKDHGTASINKQWISDSTIAKSIVDLNTKSFSRLSNTQLIEGTLNTSTGIIQLSKHIGTLGRDDIRQAFINTTANFLRAIRWI